MTTGRSLKIGEAGLGAAVLALGAFIAFETSRAPGAANAVIGPALFPFLIATGLVIIGVALLREAFAGDSAILARQPDHAPALHYSGLVLHQAGHPKDAMARLERAVALAPGWPDAWSNLALVRRDAGDLPGFTISDTTTRRSA